MPPLSLSEQIKLQFNNNAASATGNVGKNETPDSDDASSVTDSDGEEEQAFIPQEAKGKIYFWTPIYSRNPIKDDTDRDRIRWRILVVVAIAQLCYTLAIVFAFYVSSDYFNGVPTISLMLATLPLLSPFLIVFQCLYMCIILAISLTSTSASHVSSDNARLQELTQRHRVKVSKSWFGWVFCCCRMSSGGLIPTISWMILILYLLYFPAFLLIHVVKLTEYVYAHGIIAITGILIALLCHFLQFLRRYLVFGLFNEAYNKAQMIETFGSANQTYALAANFAMIFFAVLVALLFIVNQRGHYEAESRTTGAVYEYLLYGTIILLDWFRMLDIWADTTQQQHKKKKAPIR